VAELRPIVVRGDPIAAKLGRLSARGSIATPQVLARARFKPARTKRPNSGAKAISAQRQDRV